MSYFSDNVRSNQEVIIRFAGDSGDGVQSIGNQMASASSLSNNDIHSFSDFPAEIKAPAGTLAGVSGFQLRLANNETYTSGDFADVLVAFNPAALKVSLSDLKPAGTLIVDIDKFTEKDLSKAGYEHSPLDELSSEFTVIKVPMTSLTLEAVENCNLPHSKSKRCKNMFALGMVLSIYDKSSASVQKWVLSKFKDKDIAEANIKSLQAGINYADIAELLPVRQTIGEAKLPKGKYIQVTGNKALSMGCLAVADSFKGKRVVVSGYPITPASDVMQMLMPYASNQLKVVQLEDEIAAVGAALGASFGGDLGITVTSGPGLDLMQETIGLGISAELPLVIVNVQRAGPSTGMPTKSEQTDLLAAIYGRHGESTVPVIAARTPQDCYDAIVNASEVALKYMTPVIVLSESMLANGAQAWNISVRREPCLESTYVRESRCLKTMAPPWFYPGSGNGYKTLTGLEKDYKSGYISYDPQNHNKMTKVREEKVNKVQEHYGDLDILGISDICLLSWGSVHGALRETTRLLLDIGMNVEHISLREVFPIKNTLLERLSKKDKVVIVEQNSGHLFQLISSKVNCSKVFKINQVTGKPFKVSALFSELKVLLKEIEIEANSCA